MEKDCREWKLTTKEHLEYSVRAAMGAASRSYLEGGPLMCMMPLHLHVKQKSNYDDQEQKFILLFSTKTYVVYYSKELSHFERKQHKFKLLD